MEGIATCSENIDVSRSRVYESMDLTGRQREIFRVRVWEVVGLAKR